MDVDLWLSGLSDMWKNVDVLEVIVVANWGDSAA